MPKQKSHSGALKRLKVTKSGKIKMPRACGRHLRSHKSGKLLRSYRNSNYAQGGDVKRLVRLLGLKVTRSKTARPAVDAAATDATKA